MTRVEPCDTIPLLAGVAVAKRFWPVNQEVQHMEEHLSDASKATTLEIPLPAEDVEVGDFDSLTVEEIPQGEANFDVDFRRC